MALCHAGCAGVVPSTSRGTVVTEVTSSSNASAEHAPLLIGGKVVETSQRSSVTDPAVPRVVGYAAAATVEQSRAAVDAAHRARKELGGQLSPSFTRSSCSRRWAGSSRSARRAPKPAALNTRPLGFSTEPPGSRAGRRGAPARQACARPGGRATGRYSCGSAARGAKPPCLVRRGGAYNRVIPLVCLDSRRASGAPAPALGTCA